MPLATTWQLGRHQALIGLSVVLLLLAGDEACGESPGNEPVAPANADRLAGSTTAAEDAHVLLIDAERSIVRFRIGLLFLLETGGQFERIEGRIERQQGSVVVHARIPVASAQMDSGRWERMLKGPRYLDGERHPWIEFHSDPLDPGSLQVGEAVPGEVCMRGICRRERFWLERLECRDGDDAEGERCDLRASGSLLRSAYGMRSHRGAMKNEIELALDLVAVAARPAGEATAD